MMVKKAFFVTAVHGKTHCLSLSELFPNPLQDQDVGSTPIPMVRITPAIPGSVRVAFMAAGGTDKHIRFRIRAKFRDELITDNKIP